VRAVKLAEVRINWH